MPMLELNGDHLDDFWVRAVMLFPNDIDVARSCYAVEQVKAVTEGDLDNEKREVDTFTLRLLLDAPSYANLKILVTENTKRAIVAGDILAALYLMDRFKVPEPSMNKAVFFATQYAKKAKYGDGTNLAISEPMVRKYWNEFRSVSHFWAAFRLGQAYPYSTAVSHPTLQGFMKSLEVAQGILEFGTAYIPLRSKSQQAILDRENCWVLPDTIPARHLHNGAQPTGLLKILKKYKAPKSL